MDTKQIKFWQGDFGEEYTKRNTRDQDEWDQFHLNTWGLTKLDMYKDFIAGLEKSIKILEVGSNTGMQLGGLQRMGFNNLYGIELQASAVELSKEYTKGVNLIQGSGFDIPFKDGYFDLVFTSGVLIHIAPENLSEFMAEIYRCSNSYILGFEYYSDKLEGINYRGNEGFLWKADYSKLYQGQFPELIEEKRKEFKYLDTDNVDLMFLLKKH